MSQSFRILRTRPQSIIKLVACGLMAISFAFGSAAPALAKQDYSGIVIDAKTGKVLYDHRGDARAFPASLTKMMTLYMVFDQMERGKLSLNTQMRVSSNAASKQPSKLYVKAGSTISVENAIKALVTKSANDVATTIAEHIGGSEAGFGRMMTQKAHGLGMKATTFRNPSGLPDSRQVTTARDMATLGIALREHFPREFRYFNTRSFTYAGKRYGNHNRLLGNVTGVDGIKTGYTRASGFNLVSSVERDGRSIVAVVLGGRTSASRNEQMKKLIAQYIGKASRSGSGDLVARGPAVANPKAGTQFAALPKSDVPTPKTAPRVGADVPVLAYASTTPAPTPKAEPVSIDPTLTASVSAPEGWMVQVAAAGSTKEAEDMLDKILSRAPSAVSDAKPFIQLYKKNGTTYHRARFAGFNSQSDATAACKELKRKSFACYAING